MDMVEDEFNEKERIMYTRDKQGRILEAESVDSSISLSENLV